MTIKDQLNAGVTPKQLLDDLNKQIMAAQREIDVEKKAAAAKQKQNDARIKAENKVVDAMESYFNALGIEPTPDWQDNFRASLSSLTHLYDELSKKYPTKDEEPEVKIEKFSNGKKVKPTDEDIDKILKLWKTYFD